MLQPLTKRDEEALKDLFVVTAYVMFTAEKEFVEAVNNLESDEGSKLSPYKISKEEWGTLVTAFISGWACYMRGTTPCAELYIPLHKALQKLAEFTAGHAYCNAVRLRGYSNAEKKADAARAGRKYYAQDGLHDEGETKDA